VGNDFGWGIPPLREKDLTHRPQNLIIDLGGASATVASLLGLVSSLLLECIAHRTLGHMKLPCDSPHGHMLGSFHNRTALGRGDWGAGHAENDGEVKQIA
jgi:hypothetical protein